ASRDRAEARHRREYRQCAGGDWRVAPARLPSCAWPVERRPVMSSGSEAPDSDASSDVIEVAAAAWLSLRDRGMNAAETAEFVHWLQQDAQHAAVFDELDRTWKQFDRLAAVPDADAAE